MVFWNDKCYFLFSISKLFKWKLNSPYKTKRKKDSWNVKKATVKKYRTEIIIKSKAACVNKQLKKKLLKNEAKIIIIIVVASKKMTTTTYPQQISATFADHTQQQPLETNEFFFFVPQYLSWESTENWRRRGKLSPVCYVQRINYLQTFIIYKLKCKKKKKKK